MGHGFTTREREEYLDKLWSEWRRLGVLFTIQSADYHVDIESLIVQTAGAYSDSERLFVGSASWLAKYHAFVNGRRLSGLVGNLDKVTSAACGALLSFAVSGAGGRAEQLESALEKCKPLKKPQLLFPMIEQFPFVQEKIKKNALSLFRQWGFWHDDNVLKPNAVRSLGYLLTVPELRARAFVGPSVEADIVARVLTSSTTASDVSKEMNVSYAAAHAASERLVQRGILVRTRHGVRQELTLSSYAQPLLVNRNFII